MEEKLIGLLEVLGAVGGIVFLLRGIAWVVNSEERKMQRWQEQDTGEETTNQWGAHKVLRYLLLCIAVPLVALYIPSEFFDQEWFSISIILVFIIALIWFLSNSAWSFLSLFEPSEEQSTKILVGGNYLYPDDVLNALSLELCEWRPDEDENVSLYEVSRWLDNLEDLVNSANEAIEMLRKETFEDAGFLWANAGSPEELAAMDECEKEFVESRDRTIEEGMLWIAEAERYIANPEETHAALSKRKLEQS